MADTVTRADTLIRVNLSPPDENLTPNTCFNTGLNHAAWGTNPMPPNEDLSAATYNLRAIPNIFAG